MKLSGVTFTNFVYNVQLFLMAIVVFLLVLIMICAVSLIKSLREKLRNLIAAQLSGLFFNGLIQGF